MPRTQKKRSLARVIVLMLVFTATILGLWIGASWLFYRLGNTVTRNATVKGRIHKIGARLDGQVKQIAVIPGQQVRKGELILQLEDEFYQANVRQCEAELLSASRQFDAEKLAIEHDRLRLAVEVQRSDRMQTASAAEVEACASETNKWDRECTRVKTLITAGVSSASEVDIVTAQRDVARAKLKAAQGRHEVAESDCRTARLAEERLRVREAALEVLKAGVERERQRLSAARAQLDATVIRAPDDGWVIDRLIESGGSAKVGDPLISLWLGAPWIEAWVDEKYLSRIKVGSRADIVLTAFSDQRLCGRVEAIGVLADKELQGSPVPGTLHSLFGANAMIPIRISVAAERVRLQPGLSALVGIEEPGATNLSQKVTRRGGGLLRQAMALFGSRPPATESESQNRLNLTTNRK
jgi:membrane fusion protein (multidrug efflux system)